MAHPGSEPISAESDGLHQVADQDWPARFLEQLANSSNVRHAAAAAGVSPNTAYTLRRSDPDFAREWLAALAESYLHLEMEVVRRLRDGDFKTGDAEKFDFANAIRLLAAHRDAAARGQSKTRDVSAADVRASIDRKIEEIRQRMARDKLAATDKLEAKDGPEESEA